MNNLMNFQNETFGEVRAITKNNEIWFVGKDIAEKLGYVRPDHAIGKYVDDDDKLMYQIDTSGQNRKMLIINESGLYSLVLSSKLPGAKAFKKWITSDVLPQIRNTGGYIPVAEEDDAETLMAKALMVAQKTLAKKDELLKAKDKELNEKNRFIGQIAASENSLLVREVAKVASKNGITIGEKTLWKKLREWGLIFKSTTEPKQMGIDRGYFEVVEGSRENSKGIFTYKTTRVTGKGQIYIIERLLKESIEIA